MLLAGAGVALMAVSVVGRFLFARTVFGGFITNGMAASSVMLGAVALLLLAVLVELYSKKQE